MHKAAFEVEVVNPRGLGFLFQFFADDAADPDAAVFFWHAQGMEFGGTVVAWVL